MGKEDFPRSSHGHRWKSLKWGPWLFISVFQGLTHSRLIQNVGRISLFNFPFLRWIYLLKTTWKIFLLTVIFQTDGYWLHDDIKGSLNVIWCTSQNLLIWINLVFPGTLFPFQLYWDITDTYSIVKFKAYNTMIYARACVCTLTHI